MKSKIKTKIVALMTSSCFLLSTLFPSGASAFIQKSDTEQTQKNSGGFFIPESAGKITSAKFFGGDEIIVNIQDLHCHGETQKNIYKILAFLDEKYGLNQVYLEGASGDVDTTFLSKLSQTQLGKNTIEKLVDNGFLNGTEYYSALNKKESFIKGIEDKNLYNTNISLLNEIISLQPEINGICDLLLEEIGTVKTEYGSKQLKNIDKLVSNFEKKKITADKYYLKLIKTADSLGLNTDNYPILKAYCQFIQKSKNINNQKTSRQLEIFLSALKNKISYKEYSSIAQMSAGYSNIEDMAKELIAYDEKYSVCATEKLFELKNFLNYLEFANKVNPLEFMEEEKRIKENIYQVSGRTKYEREVLFLFNFISSIRGYFTADITAAELKTFKEDFEQFKRIWCSYFSENTVKKLDIYADMLSQYHNNNKKRDEVFTGFLTINPDKTRDEIFGGEALYKIGNTINKSNMKVMVTGGFHSDGLEKIFKDNKISYILIMPKITTKTEDAGNVYADTIKSYSQILKNTINIKPFMSENINENLPKFIGGAFSAISSETSVSDDIKRRQLYDFVQKEFIEKRTDGDVELLNWSIDELKGSRMTVVATYKNNVNDMEMSVKYNFSGDKFEVADSEDKEVSQREDKFFASTKKSFDKIYKVFVAPVWEETVFRFLPFVAAGLFFGGVVSTASVSIVAIVGVFVFTLAHNLKNKSDELNPYSSKRRTAYIFLSSAFITSAFLITAAVFPTIPFAAYAVGIFLHILNNALVVTGKIKGFVLSIAENAAEKAFSRKYADMMEELDSLATKKYGDWDNSWRFSNVSENLKSEFNTLLDELRKASDLPYAEKNAVLNEKLVSLYEIFTNDEVKKDNRYYADFLGDAAKIISEIEQNQSADKTVHEMFYSDILDTLAANLKSCLEKLNSGIYADETKYTVTRKAVERLSVLSDMSQEEKKNVLYDIADEVFEAFVVKHLTQRDKENDVYVKAQEVFDITNDYLLPLAAHLGKIKNKEDLFLKFLKTYDAHNKYIKYLQEKYPNNVMNNNNNVHNFASRMENLFVAAYHFNEEYAFELIKLLNENGYIDNEQIPYGIRDSFSEFKDIKKYFFAIAGKNIDSELVDALKESIAKLKELKLSDDSAENLKNNSIIELEFLSDKMNADIVAVEEYQLCRQLDIVKQLIESKDAQWADLIDALFPAIVSIVYNKKKITQSDTLKRLKDICSSADVADSGFINSLLPLFENIIKNSPKDSDTSKELREVLYSSAIKMYKDAVENGKENLKEKAFEIFAKIIESSPESRQAREYLFKDAGISVITLKVYLDALRASGTSGEFFVFPKNEDLIEYSDEIINMLAQASDIIDIPTVIRKAYDNGSEKGKRIALALINKLYDCAQDSSSDLTVRQNAAALLGMTAQLLQNKFPKELDSVKINSLFVSLGMNFEVSNPYVYIDKSSYANLEIFDYTQMLKYLPEEVMQGFKIRTKNPVFFHAAGITDKSNEQVKNMSDEFEKLQELLEFNVLALDGLSKLTVNSPIKDFENIIKNIEEMASALTKINQEHGQAALKAIENIRQSLLENGGLTSDFVKAQSIISKWESDEIDKIYTINTLVNAIHQTGIADFKEQIKSLRHMSGEIVRTVKAAGYDEATNKDIQISGYDLSDSTHINKDIKDFFMKLAGGHVSIDNFIIKDDLVILTTRLFAHSVDIFFNFGENDRGITIYYHEGGRKTGNAARVGYFEKVLNKLGFKVDADTETGFNLAGNCGLKAVLNKNTGLNDFTDMADIAYKAIELFKHSTNLDMQLEDEVFNRYSADSIEKCVDSLVEKFLSGEIWVGYNYHSNGLTAFQRDLYSPERINTIKFSPLKDFVDEITAYLGLHPINASSDNGKNINRDLIERLNSEIERAFIKGEIVLNADGILESAQYSDIMGDFISYVADNADNEDEAIRQGRTVNLAGKRKFKYETLGFVGNYMFVCGIYGTSTGNLFIKGLMNPLTGRIKYAMTEYVSYDGKRRSLSNDELLEILNESGFNISANQKPIGEREKDNMRKFMTSGIGMIESPEIICTPISDGNGTYVSGNITFDRKDVKENDILVVPYTTPDDINAIETAKGIITTGGGLLSHAAITTREYNKPSVIIANSAIASQFEDMHMDVEYFKLSPEEEDKEIDDVIIKNVTGERKNIYQGARILLNGESGTILLFDDIDVRTLDELQSMVNSDNAAALFEFLKSHENDPQIGRFVEYVYFQAMGNEKLDNIMFMFFNGNMPDSVKNKIKELNRGYFDEKMRTIHETIETLKSVDNINIAYGILDKLLSKLAFIRTDDAENDAQKQLFLDAVLKIDAERKIRDSVEKNIRDNIVKAKRYMSKEKLSPGDIRVLIKIQQQSLVYDYFVSKSELREDLRLIRDELEKTVAEISETLDKYRAEYVAGTIDGEISSFDEIYYEDIFRFGAKTTELATMYRLLKDNLGVSVPRGIGISANVFDIYLEKTGKAQEYERLHKDFKEAVDRGDKSAAKEIASRIKNLIGDKNISQEYKDGLKELEDKIESLLEDGQKYSVRSSGVGEDGESRAFAGMGESFLNKNAGEIFSFVEQCWQSFYSDRSAEYMAETRKTVKPAVLVQEMVSSVKSGVVFSRDKYGRATIETAYGLGEGVVSNTVTPDTIIVDLHSGEAIDYSVSAKNLRIVPTDEGTSVQSVTEGVNERVLDASEIKKLSEQIKILERDSGYPIDVEFAFDEKGQLFILQRRAITTLANTTKTSYVERKYNINLVNADVSDMGEDSIVVNMAHPDKNEPVSIYFNKISGNNIVLSIPSQYGDIAEKDSFINDLVERINDDEVVFNRLKKHIPLVRVKSGEIGILPPLYYDSNALPQPSTEMRFTPSSVHEILSAA